MTAFNDLVYFDSTGFHYPDYPTLLAWYQDGYRGIYGDDVYLGDDSQDAQWIAIQTQAAYDCLSTMAQIVNSYSPQFAQGVYLASNVKINGITPRVASYSTCDVTLTGTVGANIVDGLIDDENGFQWSIPSPTVIGGGGTVTVTATCTTEGAITAETGQLNSIASPQKGWLSVTNAAAATAGVDAETDAELRARQANSTMIPSLSILDGIVGALAAVDGVTDVKVYENDTGATDGDGITAHTIYPIVVGGDAQDIVDAIGLKKTVGCATQGASSGTYTDTQGIAKTIYYSRPVDAVISVNIDATALAGYSSAYETELKQAVADYINSLAIGEDVLLSRIYLPAQLNGMGGGLTYDVTDIELDKDGGGFSAANVVIDFNEVATCDITDITVTVT
jgi:uncharacterized phage protein gp47/JayE